MMDIDELKDSYSGRIFLIGNGPSLEDTPLRLMEEEYTFGVNGIPEIFDRTDWRPSFYAAFDRRVNTEYHKKALDLNIPCFFPHYINKSVGRQNSITLHTVRLKEMNNNNVGKLGIKFEDIDDYNSIFSKDVSEVVYGYNSVMYNIIQIANYMGFDEMYLVGNDLYDVIDEYLIFPEASDPDLHQGGESRLNTHVLFLTNEGKMVRSLVNGVAYKLLNSSYVRNLLNKSNHFFDQYNSDVVYTTQDNHKHILAHKLAKKASEQMSFEIYNASIGGQLEVHPRRDIYDIL